MNHFAPDNRKLADDIRQWLNVSETEFDTAVTLTFAEELTDPVEVSCRIRWFLNRLNFWLLGRKFQRHNVAIPTLPFIERDPSDPNGRLHVHIAMLRPDGVSLSTFERAVQSCWRRVNCRKPRIEVKNQYSSGWVDYIGKCMYALNTDALDAPNVSLGQRFHK